MDFPFPSQMTAMRVDRQGRAKVVAAMTSVSALSILNRMGRVGPNAEESKAEF
jgi:leucyl aminopeptidase